MYLTSLTKAASPSLRVGALITRGPAARRLQALRAVDDTFVSRPLQQTTLELVSQPSWDRHLNGLSRALNRRAGTLPAVSRYLAAQPCSRAAECTCGSRSRDTSMMRKGKHQPAAAG